MCGEQMVGVVTVKGCRCARKVYAMPVAIILSPLEVNYLMIDSPFCSFST